MTWLLRGIFRRVLPLAVSVGVTGACYSAGDGTAPPPNSLYFPVGLDVSVGGNVLYVANSDFDLQFNGGTIQSYDLNAIRQDVLRAIIDPTDPNLPLVRPGHVEGDPAGDPCPYDSPVYRTDGSGFRQPLGETCAPPVNSQAYVKDSVTIGAFATDLQVFHCEKVPTVATQYGVEAPCDQDGSRLYVPVRGDASLTWADIPADASATVPQTSGFLLDCAQSTNGGHCTTDHSAGNNSEEPGNTRNLTMPGEPFGMAIGQDGQSIVITSQTDTKVSLLWSGDTFEADTTAPTTSIPNHPALEYLLDGLPTGGNGIVTVPHDRALSCPDGSCTAPRPAFVLTSRNYAELHLLRYYSDDGSSPGPSANLPTNFRPYLLNEAKIPITANAIGTDSRGIVIDRTPRLACKARIRATIAPTDPAFAVQMKACAQTPARVFIANRAPASVLVGEIGAVAADGSYDADALSLFGNIPLSAGPSKVYLAPIVDENGNYALRLFIVCFDSATLFIYDPDAQQVENVIRVAPGPFAMTFDPFRMEDVAARIAVPPDTRITGQGLLRYRFGYIASFTESFVQVLDLDNSRADKSTFEIPVFTLGSPTLPKGTN